MHCLTFLSLAVLALFAWSVVAGITDSVTVKGNGMFTEYTMKYRT